jgi:hypothetical protein
MNQIEFTPQQQTVLDDICSGGAIHSAVAAANLLPKDVLAWRREHPHFAAASEREQRRPSAKPAPAGAQMPKNCTKMHNVANSAGYTESCP